MNIVLYTLWIEFIFVLKKIYEIYFIKRFCIIIWYSLILYIMWTTGFCEGAEAETDINVQPRTSPFGTSLYGHDVLAKDASVEDTLLRTSPLRTWHPQRDIMSLMSPSRTSSAGASSPRRDALGPGQTSPLHEDIYVIYVCFYFCPFVGFYKTVTDNSYILCKAGILSQLSYVMTLLVT